MTSGPSRVPIDLNSRFRAVLGSYWATRAKRQRTRKRPGGAVKEKSPSSDSTRIRQLESFVTDLLCEFGVPRESIYTQIAVELPGHFQLRKKWDLVVIADGQLIAALEFKSCAEILSANKSGYRIEETVSSATDLAIARREGRLGRFGGFPPMLGYFLLLEDCPRIHRPISTKAAHFSTDPALEGVSHFKWYELFCKRLVREQFYHVSCLALSTPDGRTTVTHPTPDLSFELFAATVECQIRRWFALKKVAAPD